MRLLRVVSGSAWSVSGTFTCCDGKGPCEAGGPAGGTVRTAGKAPLPQRPPRPTPRSETGAQVGSGERVVSRENMFKVLL